MFTLFHRKPHGNDQKAEAAPQPLRIEGIPEAPFTAEPDDAELAAQAVLELMSGLSPNPSPVREGDAAAISPSPTGEGRGEAVYYHTLASRIREARAKAVLQATRFVYNCELMLKRPHLPLYGKGSLQLLEVELYKRIDIIDREGGELKRRWQHCLAEVTVRLMDAPPKEELSEPQK